MKAENSDEDGDKFRDEEKETMRPRGVKKRSRWGLSHFS